MDTSFDSSIIVGASQSYQGLQACYWDESDQIMGIGDLEGELFESYSNKAKPPFPGQMLRSV